MRLGRQLYISLALILAFSNCTANALPAAKKANSGKVTVFYPKQTNDSALARALRASIEVIIDGKKAGTVDIGRPLTVTLPAGAHILRISHSGDLLPDLRRGDTTINVSPEKSIYFSVYNGASGPQAAEVDAATAQAEITGIAPRGVGGTSNVFVYWPRGMLDLGLFDAIKSDYAISIDGRRIGAITSGDYITAQLPAGRHLLEMDVGSLFGTLKQDLILGAGTTHYLLITKRQYIEMEELPAEQAKPGLKGLRQR